MKKVELKDIMKRGKTLDGGRVVTKQEMDEAMKYVKKKHAENEKLKRIDPRTGDLFVGN